MHLPAGLVSAVTTVGKAISANSPKILAGVGIISTTLAIVDAIKQTPIAIEHMESHKEEIEKIKTYRSENHEDYTDKMYSKDMVGAYGRTVIDLFKDYRRTLAFYTIGMGCFIGSVKISDDRYKIVTAELAAAVDTIASDRKLVAEAIGQEEADKIFNGVKEVIEEKEVTDEKGKTKTVKETKFVATRKDPYFTTVWTENDPDWDQNEVWREDHILSVANGYTKKIFGVKDDNGNYLRFPSKNMVVTMNDINKHFKYPEDDEYWTQEHANVGYNANHPDGKIDPHWRNVSVPDPENPRHFLDAMIITWNASGDICPDVRIVKK